MLMTGSGPPGARLTIGSIAAAQVDVTGPSTATRSRRPRRPWRCGRTWRGSGSGRGGARLVAHLHADRELAGAPAALGEDHLDRLGVLDAVVAHRTLQRAAVDDQQLWPALAAVGHRAADRGRDGPCARAAWARACRCRRSRSRAPPHTPGPRSRAPVSSLASRQLLVERRRRHPDALAVRHDAAQRLADPDRRRRGLSRRDPRHRSVEVRHPHRPSRTRRCPAAGGPSRSRRCRVTPPCAASMRVTVAVFPLSTHTVPGVVAMPTG